MQTSISGKISQPRNIRIESTDEHTISYAWDPPECGTVREYEYELIGESDYATFELHRKTANEKRATISNLLPGTRYRLRLRAVDPSARRGPWSSARIETSTDGKGNRSSSLPPKFNSRKMFSDDLLREVDVTINLFCLVLPALPSLKNLCHIDLNNLGLDLKSCRVKAVNVSTSQKSCS